MSKFFGQAADSFANSQIGELIVFADPPFEVRNFFPTNKTIVGQHQLQNVFFDFDQSGGGWDIVFKEG